MKKQSMISQKGEIEFRKKLFDHQVQGKTVIDDELNARGIEEILDGRMKITLDQMGDLSNGGIPISPYIEIGAERCQRSLVMENDLGAHGAAVDISFDMLKSCTYYAEKFNKSKLPLRVCCDAYNLPFMTSAIPFVFCYETLHHFPEISPIIHEIYRVLAPGGYFFFNEEPFKKALHINLYTNRKAYSTSVLKRSKIRKILDYFCARNTFNEIEYNIIENHSISIQEWKKGLDCFDNKDVTFQTPVRCINFNLNNSKMNVLRYVITYLLGGVVTGRCRKRISGGYRPVNLLDVIICPSCRTDGQESKLKKRDSSFLCSTCGNEFPIQDGVLFLFTKEKLNELYPELQSVCCYQSGDSSAKSSSGASRAQ